MSTPPVVKSQCPGADPATYKTVGFGVTWPCQASSCAHAAKPQRFN